MQNFIPSFHFVAPEKKLQPDWCDQAINYCYYNTHNKNLLEGKDIKEIEGYACGNFDMTPFKRMYKSQGKAMDAARDPNNINHTLNPNYINTVGVGFLPLPLIPIKLNAAVAIIQKIPVEVTATAQDPLAIQKKKEDLNFLKNKPQLEADLQPLADRMGTGKVDLGTTEHSAIPFSSSPYGLDLNEPDELQVFVDLLYNLAVEAAFETALQQFWEIKNGVQVKLMEIKDHLKFGVSVHRAFESAMTGLPDLEYVYPARVETPDSDLPDFSDNTHRFIRNQITCLELFNYFSNEICDEATLNNIINGEKGYGYCACNKMSPVPTKNFATFKLELIYCEIKSIDYVGVAPLNKKSPYNYITSSEDDAPKCTHKIWGQNTYGFWWLQNTKHFFGIHRLGFSHRTAGQESYQNFSTNIYRSQIQSAVELSIGENKKAQIADIKMQHTIIKSLPAGKYFDLKYMRNALSGLLEENDRWTQQDLMNLLFEQNIMVGDSEGFEGKNEGQFKPVQDISGGIKTEIAGYLQVIADANFKIGQFTGINDQLTGQSANPEGLIGLQKLLINSSINALHYVNEAIEQQYQKMFNNWASSIKQEVERGGAAKKAIIAMVGAKKVSLIDGLTDLPLHSIGVKISINQREEEKEEFRQEMLRLKQMGVINTVDEYMLDGVTNPKDRMALLAVKVKQWEKKQEKIRQEAAAQEQAKIKAMGENAQAQQAAKNEGEIKKVYAQGDVSGKVMELAGHLGTNAAQLDGVIKKGLQDSRDAAQLNKSIQTIQTKNDLDNQKSLGTGDQSKTSAL